jgi:hypothetical protein
VVQQVSWFSDDYFHIFQDGKGGFGGDDLWLPTVKLTLVVLLEFEEKRPLNLYWLVEL